MCSIWSHCNDDLSQWLTYLVYLHPSVDGVLLVPALLEPAIIKNCSDYINVFTVAHDIEGGLTILFIIVIVTSLYSLSHLLFGYIIDFYFISISSIYLKRWFNFVSECLYFLLMSFLGTK